MCWFGRPEFPKETLPVQPTKLTCFRALGLKPVALARSSCNNHCANRKLALHLNVHKDSQLDV
ncbi:hypothetical protein DPMN_181458 [Dreissena polymorpha]|uniref:Uncharacterized protein n=1 Tax=Dreissena polymorpha TaxID=45954 RepID=A0A9D4DFC4_DREPO|nr:hypothetical protein DPMN_181458 [Dreissena polymorpha]